jgi:hypothetical protein
VKIYFAGSIRGGRDDWSRYQQIIRVLGKYGTVLTEHVGSSELEVTGENLADRFIHDRDLGWLRDTDCLVAEVTTPSLGVGYEIGKATEWSMPVLCLYRRTEGRSLSSMIAGSPRVTVYEYQTDDELPEVIEQWFKESGSVNNSK